MNATIKRDTRKATDVRRHWGEFNDDVRVKPRFVQRNRDSLMAISEDHARHILDTVKFNVKYYTEDNGSITAAIDDFDIVENAATKDEVLTLLAHELVDYAEEYNEDFNVYFNAPNRKKHFPYIMKVLLQDDIEDVKGLLNA